MGSANKMCGLHERAVTLLFLHYCMTVVGSVVNPSVLLTPVCPAGTINGGGSTPQRLMSYLDGNGVDSSNYNFLEAGNPVGPLWIPASNFTCQNVDNTDAANPNVVLVNETIPDKATWLNLTDGSSTGVYILTLYRGPSVASIYLEVSLRDANHSLLIPPIKAWVGDKRPTNDAPWNSNRRGKSKPSGPRLKAGLLDLSVRRNQRRKGKGGGPGRGGFSSSGRGTTGSSLGYSSSTVSSRYVGSSFSRAPYGLRGRAAVVGTAFFSDLGYGRHLWKAVRL